MGHAAQEHYLLNRHGPRGGLGLGHEGHVPHKPALRKLPDVPAVEADRASPRAQQPRQRSQGRALARAVRPQERRHRARLGHEAEILQDGMVAIRTGDPIRRKLGRHARPPVPLRNRRRKNGPPT